MGTRHVGFTLKVVVAACIAVACLLLASEPAEAHSACRHHGKRDCVAPGVVHAVPQWIAPAYRPAYAPYLVGRVYHAPHRHYHARYRFPVVVGGTVVYRPYTYCGNRLFVRVRAPLPSLALHVDLGWTAAIGTTAAHVYFAEPEGPGGVED